MEITIESLRALGASEAMIDRFNSEYPNGVDVPDSDPERQEVLDDLARAGFSVSWCLRRMGESGIARGFYENGAEWYRSHYQNGQLQDPEPGVPASQWWYEDGTELHRVHCQNDMLQDPEPGVPAVQWWYENGAEGYRRHYQNDMLQDPEPGVPAAQWWYEDGTEKRRTYYQNGVRQRSVRND